ncbi:MAG TPA: Swt1 family HEPN domain-containing protein [Candidatus Bipolaricaulis anaerobius]|nr:Swt1 family HEPN domain-containing protein [Candidatus Bipolaricaulis anaerobius]HNS23548.1 Swt1 family HEPN domain-containing protein [Candidatus Bipolaricaulis anaerobius]
MATTNHERVGKALELLKIGLGPFIEREVKTLSDDEAHRLVERLSADERLASGKPLSQWDAAALLKLMWDGWQPVFRRTLGPVERSLVSELREIRNRWAHQEAFSSDDAYRALDSVERLLTAVSAREAAEVAKMKRQLLRQQFDEEVRGEKRRVGGSLVEAAATGALRPWREVISPHPDVASGHYQEAEFAADLWQVYRGEGSDEYKNPVDFFRRTYLTESLQRLLVRAVERLAGTGGDPVVQLQTNFGGGKTHSLLALYHLFSGKAPRELPGVEELLAEAGVEKLPAVHRVVLVGNKISPANPTKKPDGTEVRTLWGELAWQLGYAKGGEKEARKAFDRIRADDERATSPGDRLRELLRDYSPCLILIDEWVAYARQLHDGADLPAGSFETQFTFAQALTESAKAAPQCLVVVSLPASESGVSPHAQVEDAEVGGLRGREAQDRLRNVIGRVESSWRPASAEESFEIVRRRLFQPLAGPEEFKARDVTARAFADFYRQHRDDFPPECREADYEARIKAAYPIHPEIFDRLYSDWSTLLKFQRTRGVLRLMAAVIHCLWERGDKNPLILPSTIPLDEPRVQFELTRYLSDNWAPVIEKDIDGPNSLPVRQDGEASNLGKYAASRRVARTIFLGSAPIQKAAHQGIEDRRVHLGCVMPGEPVAVFGDALRRLAAGATYLYQDGHRYWYATQPTVTKLAEDRAEQLVREPDRVAKEIEACVRRDVRERGDFAGVHPFPQSSADVPDDRDARLVVLGISTPHGKGEESPALVAAQKILETRGNAPRLYRNALVFLAPDRSHLPDLEAALRRYLAWGSILRDKDTLDLSPSQVRSAEERLQGEEATVAAKLPEVYQWLLVPVQPSPQEPVRWEEFRLQGSDPLAVRAGKRLRNQELLVTSLGGTRLRLELDRVPLWRGDHVEVRQLGDDFARYVYLPRLKSPAVLAAAVSDGIGQLTWQKDGFAYAEDYDVATGRYRGLRAGAQVRVTEDDPGLVVKPDVAQRQLAAEVPPAPPARAADGKVQAGAGEPPEKEKKPRRPKRFHGTVVLDSTRAGRDASRVAEEVVAHLAGLPGAEVTVTLEIEALIPDGAPENVVRTVTENAAALKFASHGFEEE